MIKRVRKSSIEADTSPPMAPNVNVAFTISGAVSLTITVNGKVFVLDESIIGSSDVLG